MINAPRPPSRTYHGKIAAPERWALFRPRVGDVVVCAPPKSGTTWTQGIVAMLLAGDPGVDAQISTRAPWLDVARPDWAELETALDAQHGVRQVKTHTPFDGIPVWPDLRYICVYRHPLDVHFSFRAHVSHMTQEVLQDIFPADVSESVRIFLDGAHIDGASLSSILDHYRSALALEPAENVLRLHYADMRRDVRGAVARIAAHIGVGTAPDVLDAVAEAARFSSMKKNAGRFAVAARQGFWRDDADFFDSGTSGKWEGQLDAPALDAYDQRMSDELTKPERSWLEWGLSGS
ncbi:sulfotransferase domain-containing protein [uncultured Tateyamaria sp.]|uniref:sulfotransferase domain-containing protein n=1 Tax=uncultured Tateyamaria sp. TaxID=455651 RepID=UPI0026252F9F|nr:sulfotransferase domain-containing protein [uncultured Tateyamaria sp.]